jgi:iron complex transport system substrate-binding protein
MSMMNDNGLPAVMAGGIFDSVVTAAGGVNAFAGADADLTRTINAEQFASAEVDLVAVGAFTPNEVSAEEAQRLFDAFPQWAASRDRAFVAVSDGIYLGPTNAWAIEKIAKAAHRGRF